MERSARALGRFYTPAYVARDLVGMVPGQPANVLDLGCGRGALSLAAASRWGAGLELVTIDVDVDDGVAASATGWSARHTHHVVDLLADQLAIEVAPSSFDLALLNPPYGRMAAPRVGDHRQEYGTWRDVRCRATVFMLHACRAVRVGGIVAAILPETLATGAASSAARALIAAQAEVEGIAFLPSRTFRGTEARTVMAVLRRVPTREGDGRPWWSAAASSSGGYVADTSTLGDLGVEVVRGRLNTVEARRASAFHLDRFRFANDGEICLSACSPPPEGDDRAALAGDILVARVGRNIADKVVRVAAGGSAISDCVYRIRCGPDLADRVWRGLRSPDGRAHMRASLSGVTTQVLPRSGLLSLRV